MKTKCLECGKVFNRKGTKNKYCSKACSDKGNDAGRKLFDGKDKDIVLAKCQEVWGLGGTDEEASFFADISVSSLNRYLAKNKKVRELRDRLKERPILMARQSVLNHLKNDGGLALKFLERRKRDEFSTRVENDDLGKGKEIDDLKKQLKEWDNEDTKTKPNTKKGMDADE